MVAKSIFGAKLSNVNKPISRISDVIYLAETKLKFVFICFPRWHNMVPNQCTMRRPMSIDISEVLKCKHSFHAHFK